ncbi:hypothetical protein [Human adenovirus 14]|uniref:Uncharacterized protein n=1 Tax=Human adenovirus 14 TaxID=10521 RepID=M1Q4T9_9ADEN|nr:hypothetical protein [Human adenovirus 14]
MNNFYLHPAKTTSFPVKYRENTKYFREKKAFVCVTFTATTCKNTPPPKNLIFPRPRRPF